MRIQKGGSEWLTESLRKRTPRNEQLGAELLVVGGVLMSRERGEQEEPVEAESLNSSHPIGNRLSLFESHNQKTVVGNPEREIGQSD